jgi:hypothetical protein
MQGFTEGLVMKLKLSIAMFLVLAPALAHARPTTSGVHMRPQLLHDRTPKVRDHTPAVHH